MSSSSGEDRRCRARSRPTATKTPPTSSAGPSADQREARWRFSVASTRSIDWSSISSALPVRLRSSTCAQPPLPDVGCRAGRGSRRRRSTNVSVCGFEAHQNRSRTAPSRPRPPMSTIWRQRARRRDRGGAALQALHLGRVGLLPPDVAEAVEIEVAHSSGSSIFLSAALARESLSARAFGAIFSISPISA